MGGGETSNKWPKKLIAVVGALACGANMVGCSNTGSAEETSYIVSFHTPYKAPQALTPLNDGGDPFYDNGKPLDGNAPNKGADKVSVSFTNEGGPVDYSKELIVDSQKLKKGSDAELGDTLMEFKVRCPDDRPLGYTPVDLLEERHQEYPVVGVNIVGNPNDNGPASRLKVAFDGFCRVDQMALPTLDKKGRPIMNKTFVYNEKTDQLEPAAPSSHEGSDKEGA